MVESGVATCTVVDFKNFCHGRFIFPCNHSGYKTSPADSLVVMFITPRERPLIERILKELPQKLRIVEIESAKDNSLSTIELVVFLRVCLKSVDFEVTMQS